MSEKMTLREVLSELQAGAPVKLGLKSGYYYCGPLPENWESMIEEEHRRDMRYISKEIDRMDHEAITFSDKWDKRLNLDIEVARASEVATSPGATETVIEKAIRTHADHRRQAWDSLINRIANFTAELHKVPYLDRYVTAIYESIDPDEEGGTLCILVDGLKTGKYYTSKEYREGTGSQIERKKANE